MPFSQLPPLLAAALTERGYETPTAVQSAVLEPDAVGRDLLVSAQTGSGKTIAFGLAFAAELLQGQDRFGYAEKPLALIVAPTRELALQVERELKWLYLQTGARVASCVGGMNVRQEQRNLAQGAHIVVGTPGRLRDHLERGSLVLDGLRAVVLDEADEMLDLGFRDDIEQILDTTPDSRRTLLFSATLPRPIVDLARRYQKNGHRIETMARGESHADIDYIAMTVAPADIEHAVVNVLRYQEAPGALVFCATRDNVRRMHASLVERGFAAVALSGELSQSERSHALQALRDGRARVCVATDVAARGIDLPGLELVIHAELPVGADTLQHRSGRTGRAGNKGVCVLIVPFPRRRRAEGMMRTANIRPRWEKAPTADMIREKDHERLVETIQPGTAAEDDLAVARALLEKHPAEDIAAALVRSYRARLPEPEDMFADSDSQVAQRMEGPRQGFEDTIWFRMDVGRRGNADARWLLPLLCRRGHITKTEIGAIRIGDQETVFEVRREVAERFAEALRRTAGGEDDVAIEPLGDRPPPQQTRVRRGPPPARGGAQKYQPKPYRGRN